VKLVNDRTYIYNELYQLLEIYKNRPSDTLDEAYDNYEYKYLYDSLGRQESEQYFEYMNDTRTEKKRQEFIYNDIGMLAQVEITDNTGAIEKISTENYIYNSGGQRFIKTYTDSDNQKHMTRYLYSGTEVIMTVDSASMKKTENVLDLSGQIIVSQRFDVNG